MNVSPNINLFDKKIIIILSALISFFPILFFLGPAIPDIIVSISSIFYLYLIFKYKSYEHFKDKIFILFFLFWLFAIISTVNSDYKDYLGSIIVYVRFILFLLFVKYIISKNFFIKKYIFSIISISIIFASVDGIIQFFTGTDLFGRELAEKGQYRLSGPFESDEHILGFYISAFAYIVLGYCLNLNLPNNFKNLIFTTIFLLFFFIILISGERMALLLFLFGLFIYILFNLKKIKVLTLVITSLITISIVTFNINDKLFGRFISIFDVLGISLSGDLNEKRFRDSHYGAHYLTSLEMFDSKKILGHGVRSFRYECSNSNYDDLDSLMIESRCSTHPHNYYIQVLAENGLVGLILLILFFIFIIKEAYIRSKVNNQLFTGVFISLILFLWPLKSSFDIYNNRHALFLFFTFALIYICYEKIKEN